MTTVLESMTIPRCSGFLSTLSPSPTVPSVSSTSSSPKVGILPEFKGLRIQSRPLRSTSASVSTTSGGITRCRGRVVCEAQNTILHVPAVTDSTWQPLIHETDQAVLVEFWAPWCGPCRMIHPIIGEISKQYAGRLKCFQLNTDECHSLATQYGIRSIPTIMIFKNGEKKDMIIGVVPKSSLIASIEKFL
ncbi:PREDICTED: uncharacterized protein LOC104587148 [Nelumbo nucifera]|uniref:Uncharacterized protein LOC104587148 n=2 Tax=Nelumbo nucifera TaxID=4432 RepID=A0A1U7Z612_NELNU|nr:PREDICTED: uncharacterized protein LOC104587148 [Nelumbo nucifera]DAD22910.1 TPA_asm: hypothetical protein HUJ06_024373 [Nelumbo nucifera]